MILQQFSTFLVVMGLATLAGAQSIPAETAELRQQGQKIFSSNCVACHGAKGDGQGPAAKAISGAKPRDFTSGVFKFGASPTDVFKTITNGSAGTSMPSWKSLSENERWALVYFIRSLRSK